MIMAFKTKAEQSRYRKAVIAILDDLFATLYEVHEVTTYAQMKKITGLSVPTLRNWEKHDIKYPRLDSLYKFATSVGKYTIELSPDSIPQLKIANEEAA